MGGRRLRGLCRRLGRRYKHVGVKAVLILDMGDLSESLEDLTGAGSIGARMDAALRRSGRGANVSGGRVDGARKTLYACSRAS